MPKIDQFHSTMSPITQINFFKFFSNSFIRVLIFTCVPPYIVLPFFKILTISQRLFYFQTLLL